MPFNENMDLSTFRVEKSTPAALVPDVEASNLVENLSKLSNTGKDKLSPEEAAVAIAIICQKGGTARKAQPNIYAIVNGKKVELGNIRKVMTDSNFKYTLRQWARTKGTFINKIANHFGIEGDLAIKLGRTDSSLTKEDLYWLSNFQMDNPDCPENVKTILMNHYKTMFGGD